MDFKVLETYRNKQISLLNDTIADKIRKELYTAIRIYNNSCPNARITKIETSMNSITLYGLVTLYWEDDDISETLEMYNALYKCEWLLKEQYPNIIPVLDIIQGMEDMDLQSYGDCTEISFSIE